MTGRTATCRRCQRPIVEDADGRWIDPEATGDDSMWRETCDENHEDRIAAHEPMPTARMTQVEHRFQPIVTARWNGRRWVVDIDWSESYLDAIDLDHLDDDPMQERDLPGAAIAAQVVVEELAERLGDRWTLRGPEPTVLRPPGFEDCHCDPRYAHTAPCRKTPEGPR